MAKKKKKHIKHPPHPLKRYMKGSIVVPLLLAVLLLGAFITSNTLVNKSATDRNERYTNPTTDSSSQQNNLQLKDVSFTKVTPPPTADCNHDNGNTTTSDCDCPQALIECKDKKCIKVYKSGMIPNPPSDGDCQKDPQHSQYDGWCTMEGLAPKDGVYCLGKPVIYLYPQKPTLVDVTVKTEGKIVVSDPTYPDEGWKNVLANPDGKLLYQGKTYRELFYETESRKLNSPQKGLVFERSKLETKLLAFITQLGLTQSDEQREFLDWWLPRLKALNSPYIFVSLLDNNEKKRLDNVEINPRPDTFIDFIVYFSEYHPVPGSALPPLLVLPEAPKRVGFTAVEWGGVIGRE